MKLTAPAWSQRTVEDALRLGVEIASHARAAESFTALMRIPIPMDYAAFRQAGYPTGSGTIESACKTVVQARMKQSGMRWSRTGAQSMLALRRLLLSQRWAELSTTAPPS